MSSLLDTLRTKDAQYINQVLNRKSNLYNIYESYYLGTEFNKEFIKRYYKLYANTREFYALITRAIDIDVQLIAGDWTTLDNNSDVIDILEQSNWNNVGNLYTHYGSLFGDFYLKCYQDIDGVIKIQPLDPRGIWLDNDKAIIIRNVVNENGVLEEHGEIITKSRITLYTNGRVNDSYVNPFGVIPVFYGQNKNVGLDMGLNSFHNVMDEVNAINELATFLQEQTLRALINQKVISGALPTQLEYGPDKTIFLPTGATLNSVVGDIDIEGTLSFIQDVKTEIKNTLPEFSFDKIANPNLERPNSAASIKLQLIELITKIKRVRVNYDEVLKQAINTTRLMSGKPEIDFKFDVNRGVLNINAFLDLTNTNITL